jgi:uncharacterized integral membrane protein
MKIILYKTFLQWANIKFIIVLYYTQITSRLKTYTYRWEAAWQYQYFDLLQVVRTHSHLKCHIYMVVCVVTMVIPMFWFITGCKNSLPFTLPHLPGSVSCLVCRRPAETVSLQRRQICYRWGTLAYWSLVPRSSMFYLYEFRISSIDISSRSGS